MTPGLPGAYYGLSASARACYLWLRAGRKGLLRLWPEALARECGISLKDCYAALDELEACGLAFYEREAPLFWIPAFRTPARGLHKLADCGLLRRALAAGQGSGAEKRGLVMEKAEGGRPCPDKMEAAPEAPGRAGAGEGAAALGAEAEAKARRAACARRGEHGSWLLDDVLAYRGPGGEWISFEDGGPASGEVQARLEKAEGRGANEAVFLQAGLEGSEPGARRAEGAAAAEKAGGLQAALECLAGRGCEPLPAGAAPGLRGAFLHAAAELLAPEARGPRARMEEERKLNNKLIYSSSSMAGGDAPGDLCAEPSSRSSSLSSRPGGPEAAALRGAARAGSAEEDGGPYYQRGGKDFPFMNCRGEEEPISRETVAFWREAFPGLDIDQELAGIAVWLRGHYGDKARGAPLPGRVFMENYIANCLRLAAKKERKEPAYKKKARKRDKAAPECERRLDEIFQRALNKAGAKKA